MDSSDKQLIIDYLAGDEKSLEVLIKSYLKPIYSFVYRHIGDRQEAEDITQEVFLKAWRNFKKFDQDRSFKTWIFTIAKNTSIDYLRKKKTIPFSNFENEKGKNTFVETLRDPTSLPDEILKRASMSKVLNSLIQKLSPEYRMLLFLRYNNYFTFREIAEVLGESLNTIKSRHRRALILLKKLLISNP
ncbi:hypothetical protein AMJ49_06120 [Parcubacteria bacterium DG_74_2]|nr:MAG: hypothetical protein AMJ49_06120 [Parcubacteria bacterium DG_74_2]